jgi:hypothetical protein
MEIVLRTTSSAAAVNASPRAGKVQVSQHEEKYQWNWTKNHPPAFPNHFVFGPITRSRRVSADESHISDIEHRDAEDSEDMADNENVKLDEEEEVDEETDDTRYRRWMLTTCR